jgi:hypothetical protein
MAPRQRDRRNFDLPLNVYRNHGGYVWRHPRTGQKFGLGSNRQEAFAQAHEANLAVLNLLEKPRLVHRIAGKPETLAIAIRGSSPRGSTRARSQNQHLLA